VFAAPARATLAAKDYRQALALNRAATGRGISRQTWNILPKIRAIDTLLRESPALRDVLQECHPEVCFQVLNDGRPMQHNKQTAAGRLQRLAVLQRHLPQCQALYEQACEAYPRRELARDDILDALVCALTARLGSAAFRRLPDDPPLDGCGLPMQIVYCAPQAG
jgi:predicted RNase H-like nuclease